MARLLQNMSLPTRYPWKMPKSHFQEHTLCLQELRAMKEKPWESLTSSPAQVLCPIAQISHGW